MALLIRTAIRRMWLGFALLLLAQGQGDAATPVSESQVKAVFLFNFSQFVEWPATAFSRADAPFVIGVLGADPFGADLDQAVRGETVNKHPLKIERYRGVADIGDCQILFIPSTELSHLSEILAALKGRSVLTVTDSNDTSQRGVMIGLITQQSRIRLRIDVEAAKAGNLVFSSKLLRPAEIVGAT
jgi:YfiR/HmsC-like